jgi:WD40 repeat protein
MKRAHFIKLSQAMPIIGGLVAMVTVSFALPTYADQPNRARVTKATKAQQRPKSSTAKARPAQVTAPQAPILAPSHSFFLPTLPNEATPRVNSVDLSPDGDYAVAASDDGRVTLWELATGSVTRTMRDSRKSKFGSTTFQGPVRALAFSPDGSLIASGGYPGVALFDAKTGTQVQSYGNTSMISALAFSPDGTRIAVGNADRQFAANYPSDIKILDATSSNVLLTIQVPLGGTKNLAFSPDGRSIAVVRTSGDIVILDATNGQQMMSFSNPGAYAHSIAFSPDGRTIATGGGTIPQQATGQLKIWDVQTGRMIKTVQQGDHVNTVAFSPDGSKVAAGSWDGSTRIYDYPSMTMVAQTGLAINGGPSVHLLFVNAVVFSKDSKSFLTGSSDRTVKLWPL